jgi:hypothetical protein
MSIVLDGTSGITQMTGSIVMSGSTSGTVTIIPTATAGSNTATLPAATGTVMVSGNMPAFSAYQSSTQTLSSATFTKLQFQSKEFDTGSYFDSTTNYRFTPLVAGYYQVSGAISNNTGTQTVLSIYKNGGDFKRGSNGVLFGSSLSALVYLNGSTDYVELYGYFAVGTTVNTGSNLTYFQAVLVRGA